MNTEELIQEVQSLGGRILIDGERIWIQAPRGAIRPELAEQLRQHKQDIILQESMRRLQTTGICIAVFEDGAMRVAISGSDKLAAIKDRGTIYSPEDMYHYVQLEPHERRLFRNLKAIRQTRGGENAL